MLKFHVHDHPTTIGHPDSIYNDTSSDESYDNYNDKETKKASSSRSIRIEKDSNENERTENEQEQER